MKVFVVLYYLFLAGHVVVLMKYWLQFWKLMGSKPAKLYEEVPLFDSSTGIPVWHELGLEVVVMVSND